MDNEAKILQIRNEVEKFFKLYISKEWKLSVGDNEFLERYLKEKYDILSQRKLTSEKIDTIVKDILNKKNLELYAMIKYYSMLPNDLSYIQNSITPQILMNSNIIFDFEERKKIYTMHI